MIYNFKWIPAFAGMTICLLLSFPLTALSATFQGNVNIGANIKKDPTMPIAIPPEPISELISEITINNGEKYTNSLDVVLYFFVKDAFQVMVNNKENFYGIFWQPFQFTKVWKLAPGEDGERTVFAKLKSVSGGISEIVSDSIILDRTAPANVNNLTAAAGAKQIELKWENPRDEDLKSVRILRNEEFFPTVETESQQIVFDQKAESFIDTNVEPGRTYYYTVFSYDYAGNFSSGALISARLKSASEILEEEKETTLIPPIPSAEKEPFKIKKSPLEDLPKTPDEEIPQSVKDLTLKDFDFFQGGERIEFLSGDIVNIKPDSPLTISIGYEKLPEVLKTIIVTLEKPARFQTSWNDNGSWNDRKRSWNDFSSVILACPESDSRQAGMTIGVGMTRNEAGMTSLLSFWLDQNQVRRQVDSRQAGMTRNEAGMTKSESILWKLGFKNVAYAKTASSENSEYFSFLLRIDADKTAYQAKIAPPEIGEYPMTIGILDIKNQISKKISGTLKVEDPEKKVKITEPLPLTSRFRVFGLLVLILIGATQIPRIIKKRRYHR